jgi:hypothetical protein
MWLQMKHVTERHTAIQSARRPQRLRCFITEQNLGDCFVAAALTHVTVGPTVVPTIGSVRKLRTAAGLPETGSTSGKDMIQLLKHLYCCCVMVQPSHDTATILNATSNCARCITVAMHGISHVEPVVLEGAVQVRRLSEVVALLQGHGVHVPLADQQLDPVLAAVTTVISDDD